MLSFDLLIHSSSDDCQDSASTLYRYELLLHESAVPCLRGQFTQTQLMQAPLKHCENGLLDLDQAFINFDVAILRGFDEATQLQVGHYLYRLLFAEAPSDLFPSEEEILLRVCSEDAFIQRVPWHLMNYGQTFMALENWSITVAAQCEVTPNDVTFPAAPRVLLVCQECQASPELANNKAREHAKQLTQFLQSRYQYFRDPQALTDVLDWDGFESALSKQTWDVIYFYGHGKGDAQGASLLFSDAAGKAMEVSMVTLARILKKSLNGHSLSLLYLNACNSGSNGVAGSVTQLSELVPALVLNRTEAFNDSAREQAQRFLERLLLDHYPPHQAITYAYGSAEYGASVRWMTPILYQHYTQWEFPDSNVQRFVSKDMHWHLKLDRTEQFSRVFLCVNDMLVSNHPTTLACFWRGVQAQGVERFHERLPVELRKRSSNIIVETFSFRWPPHLTNPYKAWETIVCEGFGVRFLQALPGKLESLKVGEAGQTLLVHCRFETLRGELPVKSNYLVQLLHWWGKEVHTELRKRGVYVLLAFAYEQDADTKHFGERIQDTLSTVKLERGMRLELLNELTEVTTRDVLDFLDRFEVELPGTEDEREQLVESIVRRRKGNYECILNELQCIVSQAYKQIFSVN
ncbi:MAG: CHAT domain-containing protein [Gammaproteobacteria bacterium]